MKFCHECSNLLFPKNKKLYCRTCNRFFDLNVDIKNEYHVIKIISHREMDFDPVIIKESLKEDYVSYEDRKAFEDFFELIVEL